MILYLTTDLFKFPAQTLVNPVNTVGVMGKGLAKRFKVRFPEMYNEYRNLCMDGKLVTGKLFVYHVSNGTGQIVVNFPTKYNWRNPSKIEYIEAGLQEFVRVYGDHKIRTVSFPMLGCGNGGLDWKRQVGPMMERYLKDLPIPVYIHLYPTERTPKNG